MLGGFSVLFEAPLEKVKIVTDDSGAYDLDLKKMKKQNK